MTEPEPLNVVSIGYHLPYAPETVEPVEIPAGFLAQLRACADTACRRAAASRASYEQGIERAREADAWLDVPLDWPPL